MAKFKGTPHTTDTRDALDAAILYALKCGCLFEHTAEVYPPNDSVEDWVKWGAMRNLHKAIAEHFREDRS